MNGRLFPGRPSLSCAAEIITRVRMLLLGVLPRARRLSSPLLIAEAIERAARRGYLRGEVG
jgi:hypothetical protein